MIDSISPSEKSHFAKNCIWAGVTCLGIIGLNPSSVGDLIKIPMPPLSQERRKELIKVVKGFAEDCKVSIRNIRREANEASKKKLKGKEISSDEDKRFQEEIQKLTHVNIKKVDSCLAVKEQEIMTV